MSAGMRANLKGKIHNNLLTELLMICLPHKHEVKNILQELNEEYPPLD